MEVDQESCLWRIKCQMIPSTGKDRCFPCSACHRCLAGEEAMSREDESYCWKCFERVFALKCVSCLKTIAGVNNMIFVCYDNQVWHKECFCCSVCKRTLLSRPLTQDKRFIYCEGCVPNDKLYIH